MTAAEAKIHLKGWVKDYCNNQFLDEDGHEDLPGGVVLFLEQGVTFMQNQTGVQSESLGDHSITWTTDFPGSLMKQLTPYRRVRTLND